MAAVLEVAQRFWRRLERRATLAVVRDSDPLPRPMTGLWHQLTPEQRERVLAYDGPVGSGERGFPTIKRRA